jgi:hypothetical protein
MRRARARANPFGHLFVEYRGESGRELSVFVIAYEKRFSGKVAASLRSQGRWQEAVSNVGTQKWVCAWPAIIQKTGRPAAVAQDPLNDGMMAAALHRADMNRMVIDGIRVHDSDTQSRGRLARGLGARGSIDAGSE